MSLKKVEAVKKEKGFKILDLIVYGIILAVVVVLFIVVFATKNTDALSGVRIYSKGEAVFEYSFETFEYKQLSNSVTVETEEAEGVLTVKIISSDGYNVVRIDKSGKVKVTDADCRNKDCTYMPEITDNSGIIYCSPHGLRVVPYDFDADDGTVIM
jgi:hypothetical protein